MYKKTPANTQCTEQLSQQPRSGAVTGGGGEMGLELYQNWFYGRKPGFHPDPAGNLYSASPHTP